MFRYYNNNPKKEIKGDCVIRAISLALGMNYYKIQKQLIENSNFFNCDIIVKECYKRLLEEEYHLKSIDANGKTVEEITKDFPQNILIIRIPEHLTCAMYGVIYDIWDCSKEKADMFWIVK